MSLIRIPPRSENQITEFFDATMKQALSFGLISFHTSDMKLADAGKLAMRVNIALMQTKAKPNAAEQVVPHRQQWLGGILG